MKLVILLLILSVFGTSGVGQTLTGRIVGVADGDTVTLLDDADKTHKIRLAGIDAPEKSQPFGRVCKQSLADLIFDQYVSVEIFATDFYKREIGKITLDGRDINLTQVRVGCAWWYRQYAHTQPESDREIYRQAEEEARQARRGLWRDNAPVKPSAWRRKKKPVIKSLACSKIFRTSGS